MEPEPALFGPILNQQLQISHKTKCLCVHLHQQQMFWCSTFTRHHRCSFQLSMWRGQLQVPRWPWRSHVTAQDWTSHPWKWATTTNAKLFWSGNINRSRSPWHLCIHVSYTPTPIPARLLDRKGRQGDKGGQGTWDRAEMARARRRPGAPKYY